jgi:predicted double-glycine peptidase
MNETEKKAGGEILGRLAGLVSRPFVGASKSQGVQGAISGGITKYLNKPIEKGLRAGGVHRALGEAINIGMTPIPGTPKMVLPVLKNPVDRAVYSATKADRAVRTLSENPEIIGAAAIPLPGTTEAILGGKHLIRRALGVKTAHIEPWTGSFADEISKIANGDMLQYYADHPEKLKEKRERDRRKRGLTKEAASVIRKKKIIEQEAHYCPGCEEELPERGGMRWNRPENTWTHMACGTTFDYEKTAQVMPYQQREQWTCSAGCLKAVLAHHGVRISEAQAVELVGTQPNRGAETDQIAEGARKAGFQAFEYSFDSIEQAKLLLDQELPIICDIQSFNYPGKGHYVVMVAADDKRVELMDPNTPGNWRVISHAEMNARWWDRRMAPPNEMMWKWGIIIVPPEG